jgi:hypothetical protein
VTAPAQRNRQRMRRLGLGHSVEPRAVRQYRSLWELLVWAYRDQRAHWYLARPCDWFLWAVEESAGLDDLPRPPVHVDAAIIHAAVLDLGAEAAELVVFCARQGEPPEPCTTAPVPYPVTPDRRCDRWRRAQIGGRIIDVKISVAETVAVTEPRVEYAGRRGKRLTVVGTAARPVDVEYCPLDWQPDPSFVRAVNHQYRVWLDAMRTLHRTLTEVRMREHVLKCKPTEVDNDWLP